MKVEAKPVTNIVVKQLEESPVQVEVLASAIVSISRASEKLMQSGLTKSALVHLLSGITPSDVGKRHILAVLDALPQLEKRFTVKRTK